MSSRNGRAPAVPAATLLLLTAAFVAAFFGLYQLLESYFLARRFDTEVLHVLHVIRGITGSVLVAVFVAWYMVRYSDIGLRWRERSAGARRAERQLEHVRWFVQMRWVAAGFTLALIVIAVPLTSMLSPRYLPQLLSWWGILVVANVVFARVVDSGISAETQIVTQVVVDLVILTGLLNASGGIENPLSIAYLFHVIIAGILLPARKAFGVALIASAIFCALAAAELFHFLPHATILLFPHGPGGHHVDVHAAHDLFFVAGRVVSFVGVMLLTSYFTTLVTERLRRSERDLEQAAETAVLDHRRLEGVIDSAGLGLAVVGHDLSVQWYNPRLAEWMGWTEGEPAGTFGHAHADDRPCLPCQIEETLRTGQKNEAQSATVSSGTPRHFRHVISPVRDVEGKTAQAVVVIEDITQQKALEAEALHASRLSVLGQLAAGVAHEIGNPLSSLNARLQLMKRRDDPAFARDSLAILQNQIDRIGRIVRGVSTLARKPAEAWSAVDLNDVVQEAVSLVRFDRRAVNVHFENRVDTPLPPVNAVREQVLQVFINLLLNAVEAMPDGGTVSVTAAASGGRVTVSVTDQGPGIDENTRSHLFEPFFTSKPEGTGLGLSICSTLVHAHGGSIDAENAPAGGARFTVSFPAGPARSRSRQAEAR